MQVLTREVKTRNESVEAYTAAGRTEAADKEKAEIEIIRVYLPEQLDPAELERARARGGRRERRDVARATWARSWPR